LHSQREALSLADASGASFRWYDEPRYDVQSNVSIGVPLISSMTVCRKLVAPECVYPACQHVQSPAKQCDEAIDSLLTLHLIERVRPEE
jgi:hypothetical protein